MATAGATRTYPSQVIPSDPTDSNFEADFRTSTENLMTAVKDVDDEVSVARSSSTTTYASLDARLEALDTTAGVQASFWTIDANASGSAADSFFTVTGNATTTYVTNRPVRVITANGPQYGYVSTSSYSSSTTVNIVSNASGTALTIDGAVTSISHATMDLNVLWLLPYANLASTTTATLSGTAVAMAIALG